MTKSKPAKKIVSHSEEKCYDECKKIIKTIKFMSLYVSNELHDCEPIELKGFGIFHFNRESQCVMFKPSKKLKERMRDIVEKHDLVVVKSKSSNGNRKQ
ncbi:MAG: hypothetical protein LBC30_01290 [Puniceicoccales bacterium]|jgi:nucleoid DNA-binding protein|nr:hypothetical protein [Puniceicoccales bacterium]